MGYDMLCKTGLNGKILLLPYVPQGTKRTKASKGKTPA